MNIYAERLTRVRSSMDDLGLDTMILTPGAGMRYLTGFDEPAHERLLAVVVSQTHDPIFLTPSLNAAQVRANAAEIDDVRMWDDADGWEKLLHDVCVDEALDLGIVALDDNMPARFALTIQQLLPTTILKLAGPALAAQRACKDTLELASMQHAADATDALIAPALSACVVGASELDVALAIGRGLAEAGAEPSFEAIIGAGPNGASPHHHTGKTRLRRGDVVVLDFGARVEGYCGDITRVAAVGEASDQAREVYDVVYRAHKAAFDAVQPGATAHDVDAAARQVIHDAGYGEFFIHRTGHGIGLDEHEEPFIVAGSRTRLAPGHCFSIEPGIYLPGQFGVRLENIVTVTEDGTARAFNQPIPPELPVL